MNLKEAKGIAPLTPWTLNTDTQLKECFYCQVKANSLHYPWCDWLIARNVLNKEAMKPKGLVLFIDSLPEDSFKVIGGKCRVFSGVYHLGILDKDNDEARVIEYVGTILDMLASVPGCTNPEVIEHGSEVCRVFTFVDLKSKQMDLLIIGFGKGFDACD